MSTRSFSNHLKFHGIFRATAENKNTNKSNSSSTIEHNKSNNEMRGAEKKKRSFVEFFFYSSSSSTFNILIIIGDFNGSSLSLPLFIAGNLSKRIKPPTKRLKFFPFFHFKVTAIQNGCLVHKYHHNFNLRSVEAILFKPKDIILITFLVPGKKF